MVDAKQIADLMSGDSLRVAGQWIHSEELAAHTAEQMVEAFGINHEDALTFLWLHVSAGQWISILSATLDAFEVSR